MSLVIRHPREPSRLALAWQQPDVLPDRRRWMVGELKREGSDVVFAYFSEADFKHLNGGRDHASLKAAGFQGYPAFPFSGSAVTYPGGLNAFLRRVPPRSRSDFEDYLNQFHVELSTPLSNLALLGLTEARLPSDGFSLVDPLDGEDRTFEALVELAGYHYYAATLPSEAAPGDMLDMLPEPNNKYDRNAIRVERSGVLLGYVNRLQAPQILRDLESRRVSLVLSRLNGSRSKPKAFAVLSVREPLKSFA